MLTIYNNNSNNRTVIKATSVFCTYGLYLSQTSIGPDRLPSLCTVPAYGVFPFRKRRIRGSSCRLAPSRQCLPLPLIIYNSLENRYFHVLPDFGAVISTFHVYERNK